ncbi:MAG: membrane protein insertion efficiency factor, partial [Clostridia bacterium]
MYAYDAISKYGVLIGCLKGAWRLLRCNPFVKGGFDPVAENYRGNVRWLV